MKKHHISSFINFGEDQSFTFTDFQLYKLYDHVGYVAGYRLLNAIKHRLVKPDVSQQIKVFIDYNFYNNKEEALANKMSATLICIRDRFDGLKCSKVMLLDLFKCIEQIFSSIMNVNFLIMFSGNEALKQVGEKILSSPSAQSLFALCFEHTDVVVINDFKNSTNYQGVILSKVI